MVREVFAGSWTVAHVVVRMDVTVAGIHFEVEIPTLPAIPCFPGRVYGVGSEKKTTDDQNRGKERQKAHENMGEGFKQLHVPSYPKRELHGKEYSKSSFFVIRRSVPREAAVVFPVDVIEQVSSFDPNREVTGTPREVFQALYTHLQAARPKDLFGAIQRLFDDDVLTHYKKTFPRRRPKIPTDPIERRTKIATLAARLPEFCEERYKFYRDLIKRQQANFDTLEDRLKEAAKDADPQTGVTWHLYDSVNSSYHTQGLGADSYARGAAESCAADMTPHGLEAEVRANRREGSSFTNYEVWVKCDSLDWEIARRRPVLLRDWVKGCLQRGVNPRVYNPFLPHGIERKLGLDNFGNDLED